MAAIPVAVVARPFDSVSLQASTQSASDVIAKHRAAVGAPAHQHAYVTERWLLTENGLEGSVVVVRSGDDYREDRVIGPLHEAEGRRGGKRWREDVNGYVVTVTGIHDASAGAGPDDDGPPPATLAVLGINPAMHDIVVEATGPRSDVISFYNESTYLLDRKERADGSRWVATDYLDYANIDGEQRCQHLVSSDGRPGNRLELTQQSYVAVNAGDESALAMPEQRPLLRVPGGRMRLPATIADDRIVVTATIAKRPVNLQLDSGASIVLLDDGVAKALGLTFYGRSTETTAGEYSAAQALIPAFRVGSLELDHLFVEAAPADMSTTTGTPVAGLLGADFISALVLQIDYAAGTVDALDPVDFSPPVGSFALDARLDDNVPTIAARVGSAAGPRFILDTGADRSMLFSDFVAGHPTETADQGLGAQMVASEPYGERGYGVGGKISFSTREVKSFGLGPIEFPKWIFLAVAPGQRDFENYDYDGLIGQDVLRYFTVYIDYPHGKIYFVPNERYRRRFG